MKTPRRSLLLVLPVLALAVASCGGPGDDEVAVIKAPSGEVSISQAEFKRYLGQQLTQDQGKALNEITPLNPPAFKECIAAKREALPEGSQRSGNDASLKKECAAEYKTSSETAFTRMINLYWMKSESERRDLPLRKSALARERQTLIDQTFQGEKNYKEFLQQSGLTEKDVELNLIAGLAQQQIIADATEGTDAEPTENELRREFRLKREQLVQPETRDLRVIKAKNEADAKAAKAAIEAGKSWKDVAKQYSTDTLTKEQGGSVIATTQADQPVEFAGTVFKAKAGELLGPIKGSLDAWWVVKVQKVTPEVQPKFEEQKQSLASQLQQTRQQEAIQKLSTSFQRRWANNTSCADDFQQLVVCGGPGDDSQAAEDVSPSPPLKPLRWAEPLPISPEDQLLQQQQQQQQQQQGAAG